MEINFKIGEEGISVALSDNELELAIASGVRDALDYQIRNNVAEILRSWVAEAMALKKAEIMSALGPDIDKHLSKLRLSQF